ncbi:unnamed protein product [Adineta ricciae]|uniref:Uncharacterized protein n=1 Tax=Adineta ricciae TaxID=249248 RepID=A0A814D1W9_ADIRI|nr:unnamed protein product [Adineta ricciae]
MNQALERNTSESTYAFRFASSDQLLHLTRQQAELITYLTVLVEHKNDFLSIQNGNGEYVLHEPLEYSSFVAILRAITSQNPYKLLDELS